MFKKYKSIENSYRSKYILKYLEQYPELQNCKYVVREKIDGANIQILFTPNEEIKVGKRNSFLSKDSSFFDIWNTLAKYEDELQSIQELADLSAAPIRMYGEIYGSGIQKRVQYGEQKYITFFDMEVLGNIVTQENLEKMMESKGISYMLPPLIGYADNLGEALAMSEDFDSKVLGNINNPAEGFVIKPFDFDQNLMRDPFILKKKSESFSEKMKVKSKKGVELSPELITLSTTFKGYITSNRLDSVISKEGPIESMKDIGKYIQLLMADAKEDFLKENNINDVDSEKLNTVFKVGGLAAKLVKERL